ncbi:helix-turn-helix domain-containing protein [Bradyrhizobium sp.]|jgi:AraC family ethanolamine operon transcriptional activator|uniref:AraC family transcriptional regulator n=1 Tax=Bradyrhizobium sp. TaxID=376 RepID=UPI003C1B8774
MLFQRLNPSEALNLVSYADIDHFRESERYLRASSMPLAAGDFSIQRAELALPSCTLSLVRTFPRIVNGYELAGRLVFVIPMNDVSTARINGEQIGQAVLVLKGNEQRTVFEPEGRLVAILSIEQERQGRPSLHFDRGYQLINLSRYELLGLRAQITGALELAAKDPEASRLPAIRVSAEDTLLAAIERATRLGELVNGDRYGSLGRYKRIIDQIDNLIQHQPTTNWSCEQLSDELGTSTRTIQTATQTLCGSGTLHYWRLRRLWMVRRQLRSGVPGLTVRASALAHGFHHMGEFSKLYCSTFGELPSYTLAAAR